MITVKEAKSGKHLGIAQSIRRRVFIEGLGRSESMEWEFEKEAHAYLAFIDQVPAGTARWLETKEGIEFQRFAVLPAYQGLGIGTALLRQLITDVRFFNKKIYLHSLYSTLGFYSRNSFAAEGEPYIYPEDQVKYIKMRLL